MNKTLLVVIIGIVLISCGIGGYLFLAKDQNTKEPVKTDTNQQSILPDDRVAPPADSIVPSGQPLDLDAPVPTGPVEELKTYSVGPVELSVYDPITITGLENSTNIYFSAHNTGASTVTLTHSPFLQQSADGGSDMHLYWMTNPSVLINPDSTVTIEYMSAPFKDGDLPIEFTFAIVETGDQETITVTVANTLKPGREDLPNTATINGTITDESGNPISGADVSINFFNSERVFEERTRTDGTYAIALPSSADVEALLGDRDRAYDSLGFFVYAQKEGYSIGYEDDITIDRGMTKTVDFSLTSTTELDYVMTGETQSDGVYGYWWIRLYDNASSLAAVQGRHPAELNRPGHFLSVDTQGNEQWRVDTNDECWGFDVSKDGLIAAACHEGTVYVTASDGTLLWDMDAGGMSRDIEFSNNGTKLVVGPYQEPGGRADFAVVSTTDGSLLWTGSNVDNWLRNARWSADDQYLTIGLAGGVLMLYNADGILQWTNYIGEFPMVLEIDDSYNVYAAGKNRELFSYDVNGDLNWRRRIGNHVVTAGANNMPDDGSMIVFGTVGAKVFAFSPDGEILWQRSLMGELQGHNALDMTPDGEYIIVGTAGTNFGGYLHLYDKNGTLLWQHQSTSNRSAAQAGIDYDHNQTGAITVTISDDGKYIGAGYGDSTIRIFERQN